MFQISWTYLWNDMEDTYFYVIYLIFTSEILLKPFYPSISTVKQSIISLQEETITSLLCPKISLL